MSTARGLRARDRRISARIGALAQPTALAGDPGVRVLGAGGRRVIGFGSGEPDFPTPGHIVDAAVSASRDPRSHRYPPSGGLPELRAAIAAKTLRDSGWAVGASQVLVTNGSKQAIHEALVTLLDPGDEVIVPAPYWTTYPESIQLAGGVAVTVLADETADFKVTVDQLEAVRTADTRLLLFASPCNPTGSVYDRAEVEAIGRWAREHGLWVLTDEVFEHLVYDDAEFVSLPVAVPELADTCIVVNGVAKTYAMTGWGVGWMIGPQDVVQAATNLQSHTSSSTSFVAQRAAMAAVSGSLTDVAAMKAALDRRRQTIVRTLNNIPGVSCPEPGGALFVYPSVKGLLGKEIRGRRPSSSAQLAALILEEAQVTVIPGEAFGSPGYLRLSYALGDDALVEGVSRLQKLLGEAA